MLHNKQFFIEIEHNKQFLILKITTSQHEII